MKNLLKYSTALILCALWLAPALPSLAAQDENKKSAPAVTKPAPAKAKAPAKAAPKNTKGKKSDESPEAIKAKLDVMGKQLVVKAAATVSPSLSKKAVTPEGGGYVARYTEIDTTDIVTELIQSTGPGGKYIGSIKYLEIHYECPGKTQDEALKAPCTKVKARRMNELVRYDGKWMF